MKFKNVDVEFSEHRWYVKIHITMKDGTKKTFVADASYNAGDGVWFGTQEEYEDWW